MAYFVEYQNKAVATVRGLILWVSQPASPSFSQVLESDRAHRVKMTERKSIAFSSSPFFHSIIVRLDLFLHFFP